MFICINPSSNQKNPPSSLFCVLKIDDSLDIEHTEDLQNMLEERSQLKQELTPLELQVPEFNAKKNEIQQLERTLF